VWRTRDFQAGRCSLEDIGKPKPPEPEPTPEPVLELAPEPVTVIAVDEVIDPKESPGDKVVRLTMQALDDLGGVEFFKAHPDLMKKVLTKIAPSEQMRPRFIGQDATGNDWPEWLTARRLAYQESAIYAEDVKAKEPVRMESPEVETSDSPSQAP